MPQPAARSKASSSPAVKGWPVISQGGLCARLRLYVVIDPQFCHADPVAVCRDVLEGGATAFQLRDKHGSDRETLELAMAMRSAALEYQALFVVNDRLDLALACGADGVHLGVNDLPLAAARAIGGEKFVIGYSPETDEQAANAASQGADYLGAGPLYGTTSKDDAGPALGLETLILRRDLSGLPVVGIGGITMANAREVVEAGACGVAVMSAVIGTTSPKAATREIADQLNPGHSANQ